MKHVAFFRKHPVLTGEELDIYLSATGERSSRAKESLLTYHRKVGHLVLVRRGPYGVIPPGADQETYPVNPFLVAAKLAGDSVLSHHTALEIHGHAYSVREQITYSASHPVARFSFRSHVFRGVRFPHALCSAGKENFGVNMVDQSGMEAPVTSLERTLVDVLEPPRPDLSGSWEEIYRSLESFQFFDLDKVIEYALLLGNKTTTAKVGFFLEQHSESLMVTEDHLKSLENNLSRQPHYLENTMRYHGKLIKRWKLVIPDALLEQTWGEVA
jgi:predicted transcriptional regulator of viral defense system